jgi:hypothetical protein
MHGVIFLIPSGIRMCTCLIMICLWRIRIQIGKTSTQVVEGSGRNAHKSFLARKLKGNSSGLHPKVKEKTPELVQGLSISKRNQPLFDGSEYTPIQVSESAVGQSEMRANNEEPVTPEKPTASSSSSSYDFQGSIPFSFEIAQPEQSPGVEGGDRRLSLVGILDEVEAGARRAERAMAAERAAMAAEAAALLDSAFQEVTSPIRERAGHLGSGEESEGERIRRRPLSDLGNIKVSESSSFLSITVSGVAEFCKICIDETLSKCRRSAVKGSLSGSSAPHTTSLPRSRNPLNQTRHQVHFHLQLRRLYQLGRP